MFEDPYSQFVLNESKWIGMVEERAKELSKIKTNDIKLLIDRTAYASKSAILLNLMSNLGEKYKRNFWFPINEEKFKPLLKVANYLETEYKEGDDSPRFRQYSCDSTHPIICEVVCGEELADAIELCLELAAGECPKENKGIYILYPELVEKLRRFVVLVSPSFSFLKEHLPQVMSSDWKYEFVELFKWRILPMMRRELREIGVPSLDDCDKGKKKE